MEEIGTETTMHGAGRLVKSFLIGMSVVFMGPVGLLFVWLWRREWLQKRSLAVVTILWSVIYIIGVLNSPRDEEPATTVSASEVDVQPESISKLGDKIADKENLEEEGQGEKTESLDTEPETESAPAEVGDSYEPTHTAPTPETPTPTAPATTGGGNTGFPDTGYEDPAGECIIKGNVNSKGEKIYHTPESKSYKRTKINPDEGDQLFCTRQEAEAAGFRAAED